MRSIPFNTTIAYAFGAASAEGTSLPCSNFFRKFCDTTGKEPNHKINKAKIENWRLRNETMQNRHISDRPKGLKTIVKFYAHHSLKKILSSLWRGLLQAYALPKRDAKDSAQGCLQAYSHGKQKCVRRDQYNRSSGPTSSTELKASS